MHIFTRTIAACLFAVLSSAASATEQECIDQDSLVDLVREEAKNDGHADPEFKIKRATDGQSLIYWHFGKRTGSFYAATFRSDGCAILTVSGQLRRFAFPKTAFNTGVFFELDPLKTTY